MFVSIYRHQKLIVVQMKE